MKSKIEQELIYDLLKILDVINGYLEEDVVMQWAAPIIAFGNIKKSKIATLGINPSNNEFLTSSGVELDGSFRRFPTLNSLGISEWGCADEAVIEDILDACNNYFTGNPYNTWFKKLDYLISGTGMSYYFPSFQACHLDLVPFATFDKWGNLSNRTQNHLLSLCVDFLGHVINCSSIEMLVLNGRTVISYLERVANTSFAEQKMDRWSLPRKSTNSIQGYAYTGNIEKIGSVPLLRPVSVLGYNHNIQSSYGVTTKNQQEIKNWINERIN